MRMTGPTARADRRATYQKKSDEKVPALPSEAVPIEPSLDYYEPPSSRPRRREASAFPATQSLAVPLFYHLNDPEPESLHAYGVPCDDGNDHRVLADPGWHHAAEEDLAL